MKERSRFKEIYNYALYYGHGELEKLAQFQAAIVEPAAYQAADIAYLKSRNTLVIAYLSVMEMPPYDNTFQLLQPEDFIVDNGQYLKQEAYETYLLNVNSKHWRSLLFYKAGRLLLKEGYDGIFLDTIGDVENPKLPNPSLYIQGAVEIVKELRAKFPEAILIQNNGLEIICTHTAPYLDGLVWENAPVGVAQSRVWVDRISEKINQLRDQYSLRILLLYEDAERSNRVTWAKRRRLVDTNEYLIYTGLQHYLGEVNLENR